MKKEPLKLLQVRIPVSVLNKLDEMAEKLGMPRSNFVGMLLREIVVVAEEEGRVRAERVLERIPGALKPPLRAVLKELTR